jgi:hypothetical protein
MLSAIAPFEIVNGRRQQNDSLHQMWPSLLQVDSNRQQTEWTATVQKKNTTISSIIIQTYQSY